MYRITIDVGGTFTDCLVMDDAGSLRQFKSYTTPRGPVAGVPGRRDQGRRRLRPPDLARLPRPGRAHHPRHDAGHEHAHQPQRRQDRDDHDAWLPGHRRDPARLQERADLHVQRVRAAVRAARAALPPAGGGGAGHCTRRRDRDRAGRGRGPGRRRARSRSRASRRSPSASCTPTPNPTNERRAARDRPRDPARRVRHGVAARSCPSGASTSGSPRRSCPPTPDPVVERYLRTLVARLAEEGFTGNLLMMLSDGLVETVDYCIPRVVYLIGSGPAAAPVRRAPHRRRRRHARTSCRWTWAARRSTSAWSATARSRRPREAGSRTSGSPSRWSTSSRAAPAAAPSPGSTSWACCAWGPDSAGGDPGPACYGKGGTEPTVTDADLVLGYVPADFFLGGEIPLDAAAADDRHPRRGRPAGPVGRPRPPRRSSRPSTPTWRTRSPRSPPGAATTCATSRSSRAAAPGPVHAASIADLLHMPDRWSSRPSRRPTPRSACSPWTSGATTPGRTSRGPTDLDLDRVNGLYAEMEAEAHRGLRRPRRGRRRASPSRAPRTCATSASSTRSRWRSRRATWPMTSHRDRRSTASIAGTSSCTPSTCPGRASSC